MAACYRIRRRRSSGGGGLLSRPSEEERRRTRGSRGVAATGATAFSSEEWRPALASIREGATGEPGAPALARVRGGLVVLASVRPLAPAAAHDRRIPGDPSCEEVATAQPLACAERTGCFA